MANGKRQTSDKISLPFSGRLQGVECRVQGAGGGCCSSLVVLTSTALLMHSHSQPALTSLLHFAFIWLNVLVWFPSYACGPRTRSHATSPSPSPSAIPWYFHVSKFVQVKFARWWWCYEWLWVWVCHRRAAVKQATSDHINEAFCKVPPASALLHAACCSCSVRRRGALLAVPAALKANTWPAETIAQCVPRWCRNETGSQYRTQYSCSPEWGQFQFSFGFKIFNFWPKFLMRKLISPRRHNTEMQEYPLM